VFEEGLRQDSLHVGSRVTGRALASLPLLFMLVAAEALGHRRYVWSTDGDDTGVTMNALSVDRFQGQVTTVVECDGPVRQLPLRRKHRCRCVFVPVVAALALVRGRHRVSRVAARHRMAARATQAFRSRGSAASEPCQVQRVREARLWRPRTGGEERDQEQQQGQAATEEPSASRGHRPPRSVAKSKS